MLYRILVATNKPALISLYRTTADNQDFQQLVARLNADLAARHGADHPLAQFNPVSDLKHVLVAYDNQRQALGCGAIGKYDAETMEIKRMYVAPETRGKRIGKRILGELEQWARDLGNSKCILFMGIKQPEATRLYERMGYQQVPKYGKLAEIDECLCMAKVL